MSNIDFYGLDSTKFGEKMEELTTNFNEHVLLRHITERAKRGYRTSHDIKLLVDSVEVPMEIKGDNHRGKYSRRIPVECMQQSKAGDMLDSGIRKTSRNGLFSIYCCRLNILYVFKVSKFFEYLKEGYISSNDIEICNKESPTGVTHCYMIDAILLEKDGFFEEIHKNVLQQLDNAGFPVNI